MLRYPSNHPRCVASNCLNSWAFFITAVDPPLVLPRGRGKWGECVKVGGPGVGGSLQERVLGWGDNCLVWQNTAGVDWERHQLQNFWWEKQLIIVTLEHKYLIYNSVENWKKKKKCNKAMLMRFQGRTSTRASAEMSLSRSKKYYWLKWAILDSGQRGGGEVPAHWFLV